MIFFWYHKVLITIWIGIFACKHLLSSNNFSQAKILQSGVKFTQWTVCPCKNLDSF